MEDEIICKDKTIFISYTLSSWSCEMHDWQYIFDFLFFHIMPVLWWELAKILISYVKIGGHVYDLNAEFFLKG